jgi:hypothetical protein
MVYWEGESDKISCALRHLFFGRLSWLGRTRRFDEMGWICKVYGWDGMECVGHLEVSLQHCAMAVLIAIWKILMTLTLYGFFV